MLAWWTQTGVMKRSYGAMKYLDADYYGQEGPLLWPSVLAKNGLVQVSPSAFIGRKDMIVEL